MNYLNVTPGDIVVTNFGVYQHWSVVSDRFCENGRYLLISATKRLSTVEEEPWDTVTSGRATYVADIASKLTAAEKLKRARSQIGHWVYTIAGTNCEQFAKWVYGLPVYSQQVRAVISGATVGALTTLLMSENFSILKVLACAALVAVLFLLLAKPAIKTGSIDKEVQCDKPYAALQVCV